MDLGDGILDVGVRVAKVVVATHFLYMVDLSQNASVHCHLPLVNFPLLPFCLKEEVCECNYINNLKLISAQ